MNSSSVLCVSECFVKPKYTPEDAKKPLYLSPWDLAMPCVHYIQKGLLFTKPPETQINEFLQMLKDSLSIALIHFYPLSGRLQTLIQENPPASSIYVDCTKSPGARFVHATLNWTIQDILSPIDVPQIVQSFFDHDRAINHDGHTLSLLTIQVTELIDGIFIGCSMNHMIADGSSYWQFFNSWSEIFKTKCQKFSISRPPVHTRYIPDGHGPLTIPFTHHDQFISRHEAPEMRERIFHFSSEYLAKLKAKANAECKTKAISTLQALSAHVWRCITRARNFQPDKKTTCRLATNNRSRLSPPFSQDYFGNCIQTVEATTTSSELLGHGLGYAAWLLNQAVINHTDKVIRGWIEKWLQSPIVYNFGQVFDPSSIMMGSSPRFDMYGNEFGLGKAVAIRSGYANKFDGKVTLYPGVEGGGSMDLEICLPPHSMNSLESDQEFMETAI